MQQIRLRFAVQLYSWSEQPGTGHFSTFGNSKGQNGSIFAGLSKCLGPGQCATTLYGAAQFGGDTAHDRVLIRGSGWPDAAESSPTIFRRQHRRVMSAFRRRSAQRGEQPRRLKHNFARRDNDRKCLLARNDRDAVVRQIPVRCAQPWSFQSAPLSIAIGGDGNIYGTTPRHVSLGERASSVTLHCDDCLHWCQRHTMQSPRNCFPMHP